MSDWHSDDGYEPRDMLTDRGLWYALGTTLALWLALALVVGTDPTIPKSTINGIANCLVIGCAVLGAALL